MARNRFYHPTWGTYTWDIGHSEEEQNEQRRNIERTAPTSGVGLVRQQGDDSPMILRFNGTILTKAQRDNMQLWYDRCRTTTIHFYDFLNNQYEVLITAFNPQRIRTVRNPRGGTTNPNHYWRYTIEMEVIRVISGSMP